MQKSEKMVLEITEKRKMTKPVIDALRKRIFFNMLMAIGIMLYLCMMNVAYMFLPANILDIFLKVAAMVAIFVTVVVLEISYRRDTGRGAIIGIELLIFSCVVLFIPSIYKNLDDHFGRVFVFLPIYCAVYYVIKAVLLYRKTQRDYRNNLSDVKEIVREDS